MSSTNKTTHYNLSQYVSTDKPTYLVDYNADMSAIDTGIYNAKSEAETNTSAIGTLSNLTTTEKSNLVGAINEVDGNVDTLSGTVGQHTTDIAGNTAAIGNLANLETTNKTNLVAAVNEVDGNIDDLVSKFDLTATSYGSGELALDGCTLTSGSITVAKNSDGSLCKVYGELLLNKTQQVGTITIHNAGINPTSEFTVSCAGFEFNANIYGFQTAGIIFKTNGDIDIISYGVSSGGARLILMPFVIFTKDFGDQSNQ